MRVFWLFSPSLSWSGDGWEIDLLRLHLHVSLALSLVCRWDHVTEEQLPSKGYSLFYDTLEIATTPGSQHILPAALSVAEVECFTSFKYIFQSVLHIHFYIYLLIFCCCLNPLRQLLKYSRMSNLGTRSEYKEEVIQGRRKHAIGPTTGKVPTLTEPGLAQNGSSHCYFIHSLVYCCQLSSERESIGY